MKMIKWKTMIITGIVCLVPVFMGMLLWEKLPNSMAIHFDISNNPDNFASKGFAVFGLPLLMMMLQIICCVINDVNAYKYGDRKKFETVTKWIVPVMTIILQMAILGYGLGMDIDMRKLAAAMVGIIFLILGNYLPKFETVKNYNLDVEKAKRINRFIGYASVVMGIIFIISVFLPNISTIISLLLLIPYAVICVIYGVFESRK